MQERGFVWGKEKEKHGICHSFMHSLKVFLEYFLCARHSIVYTLCILKHVDTTEHPGPLRDLHYHVVLSFWTVLPTQITT